MIIILKIMGTNFNELYKLLGQNNFTVNDYRKLYCFKFIIIIIIILIHPYLHYFMNGASYYEITV